MSTQPQQQQVIVRGRQQRKYHPQQTKTPKRKEYSGTSFRPSRQRATRTSPYSTLITNWRTTTGSPASNQNKDHQDPPECNEPPMDPPEHLQMAKAQELLKQGIRHQNLTLELRQVQVLLLSLLIHLRTLLCSGCGKSWPLEQKLSLL